jgi:hypothetical protein
MSHDDNAKAEGSPSHPCKGVVTIDPLYASPKRQKQISEVLQARGFRCELRQRFDRLHIVTFEIDTLEGDQKEEVYRIVRESRGWHEKDCHIKILAS